MVDSRSDADSNETTVATILLVEDETPLRQALTETLQSLGYAVHAAANGDEALMMAHNAGIEKISLVVSDLVMPGMNAYELYEALRLRSYKGDMLIITGYPMPYTGATLVEKPGVKWASKPITMGNLRLLTAQMVHKR